MQKREKSRINPLLAYLYNQRNLKALIKISVV